MCGADGTDQFSSVPNISLCSSEATLDRSTHLVHVSYCLPATPADLSLPVSTRALLPIKLSLKGHSKVQGVSLLLLSARQPKAGLLRAKLNPNSKNTQMSSEPGFGLRVTPAGGAAL